MYVRKKLIERLHKHDVFSNKSQYLWTITNVIWMLLKRFSNLKTPWVIDGASSNYHSMITYSQKVAICE